MDRERQGHRGLLQWMKGNSFIRREFTGPIQAASAK
jgi:hypothetical protein